MGGGMIQIDFDILRGFFFVDVMQYYWDQEENRTSRTKTRVMMFVFEITIGNHLCTDKQTFKEIKLLPHYRNSFSPFKK